MHSFVIIEILLAIMRANNFQKKSEDKSRTIRMLHRQQMFEKKRK